MLSHDEIVETIDSQTVNFGEGAVSEAVQIEEVLNRAHQIHRSRGGLFGYDLEDWLQAQRELTERKPADRMRIEETRHAESLPWG
jgi:hypothetical protein